MAATFITVGTGSTAPMATAVGNTFPKKNDSGGIYRQPGASLRIDGFRGRRIWRGGTGCIFCGSGTANRRSRPARQLAALSPTKGMH